MKTISKFIKWVWYSSDNPDAVSKTIKGIGFMLVPSVITLAESLNISWLQQSQLMDTISQGALVIGSVLTFIGVVRKIYNTYSGNEVVTFIKKKSTK